MGRYLIVANQTLGEDRLRTEIDDRVASGDADFHVVVPMTPVELEAEGWVPADPVHGTMPIVNVTDDAVAEARRRTEHRLDRALEMIRSAGGEADGEIGDADPYVATRTAIQRERFDEVIVSTLPAGISRWLKMDLPSRVERLVDVPVTVVEAER